ncbi:hypothetical protein M434DRAFT_399358, partial [Hypoxylon sp. CO27-5]
MAPSIHWRSADDAFDAHTSTERETRNATGQTMQPWTIVAIVLGVLTFTSLVVFLVLYLLKKRRKTGQNNQNPLGWRGHKRGKMSETDRLAAEEIERATMIRKSLASRTSSMGARNSQDSGLPNYHQLEDLDREEHEEHEGRE